MGFTNGSVWLRMSHSAASTSDLGFLYPMTGYVGTTKYLDAIELDYSSIIYTPTAAALLGLGLPYETPDRSYTYVDFLGHVFSQ